MSNTFVEISRVDYIDTHPYADRLEIARVGGATVVVPKGQYARLQLVAYFPPNILIPNDQSHILGVTNYLRPAFYPGDGVKSLCRVAACRIRGVPSYGFIAPIRDGKVGDDISSLYGAVKYEPPLTAHGDADPELPGFHRYTDIESYLRHPRAIPDGTPVRVTEKLHGTNSRVGFIGTGNGEFLPIAGTRNTQCKPLDEGGSERYWFPMQVPGVLELLTFLCDEEHNVILFGEIFGPTVQDMDYGVEGLGYRVFDISVNGEYLGWELLRDHCEFYQVPMVPTLYEGRFSPSVIDRFTHGETFADPRCDFKGREGIVITPVRETYSPELGGRMILKSVSVDYLARKGAQDNA